jgi:peptidoglycan/xylan/chitin deacetylase (PgdA/CDA1 family)
VQPVLNEFGYPSSIFVVTGLVGKQALWVKDARNAVCLMTAPQLRSLNECYVEIGSHSITHRKLPELDPLEAASELRDSKTLLEDILCYPVTSFAYPHGRYDASTVELVAAAGYQYAYSTDRQQDHNNADNDFLLPRTYITHQDDLKTFASKIGVM